jgi:uncharacterized membrane protein YjdF
MQIIKLAVVYLSLFLVAEIVASGAVWHDTPTDWGNEHLSFWVFERMRFRRLSPVFLIFASLSVVGWIACRHFSSALLVSNLLTAVCALGTEVLTSVYFWKQLSVSQTQYLGWIDHQRYIIEHLVSWAVVVLGGLGLLHVTGMGKRKRS